MKWIYLVRYVGGVCACYTSASACVSLVVEFYKHCDDFKSRYLSVVRFRPYDKGTLQLRSQDVTGVILRSADRVLFDL